MRFLFLTIILVVGASCVGAQGQDNTSLDTIHALYIPFEAFTPLDKIQYETFETSSYREEDEVLISFLESHLPSSIQFSLESLGSSNPRGCGGRASTWLHLINDDRAVALTMEINNENCAYFLYELDSTGMITQTYLGRYSGNASLDYDPNDAVYQTFFHRQWYSHLEVKDESLLYLESTYTELTHYNCQGTCRDFESFLKLHRDGILLVFREEGLLVITIPLLTRIFFSQNLELSTDLEEITNELGISIENNYFEIDALTNDLAPEQQALLGRYTFEDFILNASVQCDENGRIISKEKRFGDELYDALPSAYRSSLTFNNTNYFFDLDCYSTLN